MTTIAEEIGRLQKEAIEKQEEVERLKRMHTAFPNLKKHINRWKTVRYCSDTVNTRADKCEIRYNCGCCSDSPLEVWPYVDTEFGQVFTDPPVFQVGEKHWIAGDRPNEGWKQLLRDEGIQETIIELVADRFKRGVEERKALAEDDYEDED